MLGSSLNGYCVQLMICNYAHLHGGGALQLASVTTFDVLILNCC